MLSNNKIICACGCGEVINRYNKHGYERRFKNGHNCRIREKLIICSICGSDKTYIRKSGQLKDKKDWYRDDAKKPVCCNCYNRLFLPKFRYKGRNIYLDHQPRIGVCNWCRKVSPFDTPYTQLHHYQDYYDDSNPLRNTIEICLACHMKETIPHGGWY